jgi:cellulose synthase/poly-beta-1,6-N-acetylglucosamine synthase-like glycosyltransferase
VPYCDVPAMAQAVENFLRRAPSEAERARMAEIIQTNFEFSDYVLDLLRLAVPSLPTISVAVPNYNYAHCLPERLYTIFDQNHPVEEIIVLDDCSSDDSVPVIMKLADERQRDLTLVINEQNSGSVFAQWAKAAEMARGEFLWIAEADDLSEPTFLSSLLALMKSDPDIAAHRRLRNPSTPTAPISMRATSPITPLSSPARCRAPRCSTDAISRRAISASRTRY